VRVCVWTMTVGAIVCVLQKKNVFSKRMCSQKKAQYRMPETSMSYSGKISVYFKKNPDILKRTLMF